MHHHRSIPRLCVANVLLNATPGRLVAEMRSDVVQQLGKLLIIERTSEAGHDRAAFALRRRQPPEHDVDDVASVRTAWPGAQRKIDPAERKRTSALVAVRACCLIDAGPFRLGARRA